MNNKITQSEQRKNSLKKKKKMKRAMGTHGNITKDLTSVSLEVLEVEEKEGRIEKVLR